jgi:superfamily II DNA/RNA helicase
VLHGELDQRERNRVMGLLRSGQIRVLVGTDLAARGLDLQGLGLVVNFELPRSGEDYLHRTGRTGRAGRQGLAISLVSAPEWNRAGSIERYLHLAFERRTISGLEAKFRGPRRQKGSGQAAGKKQQRRPAAQTTKARSKQRERDRKDKGKPRRLKRRDSED